MFNYIYETKYSDLSNYDTIKKISLMDTVQEAAIRDSAACGYGINELRKMNKAWLLKGFTARFCKPAVSTSPTLNTFTAVKKFRAATSHRGAIVRQDGEIILKSIADWFLFDTVSQRPCKIPDEMLESYQYYDFNDDFFEFKKPPVYDDASIVRKIYVGNKDIDTNRHMNNLKSAEVLMDALPYDFDFADMSIIYKKQAYLGEELLICKKELPNGYYIHLETPENEVCVAGIFTE